MEQPNSRTGAAAPSPECWLGWHLSCAGDRCACTCGCQAIAALAHLTTPRALKVNLGRAAKQLDLRLHWFSPATENGELVVELRS